MNSVLWEEIEYKLSLFERKSQVLENELNSMRLNSKKKISNDILDRTKKKSNNEKIDTIKIIIKKKVKTKKRKKGERRYFNNRVIDTSDESQDSE